MKQKILLSIVCSALILSASAQKKSERTTAYAITGAQKGSSKWTEVNLVDVVTGEVISPVYQSKVEVKKLNARTGKPILVKDAEQSKVSYMMHDNQKVDLLPSTKSADRVIVNSMNRTSATKETTTAGNKTVTRIIIRKSAVKKEEPFATNSAACAYDKKHNRLYYTPMGINQLRYIDLKAKSPSIYYFEDEAFGTVANTGDVQNQITRMVIASDGNGYALTNNAEQLIQFTTKNKPSITNLGAINDDPSNGKFSIKNSHAYGGDMVADDAKNLYLITANRRVYKISIENKTALYVGSIKGLPDGYTTNGAVVEKGNSIVVTSSNATTGYYKFDLKALQAEKISSEGAVFNASDLANANLLSAKKTKEEKKPEEPKEDVLIKEEKLQNAVNKSIRGDEGKEPGLAVYPNPVTASFTRLSMTDYPDGDYEVQLLDLSGKLVKKQAIRVNGKSQVANFNLPGEIAKGTYLIRVQNESGSIMNSEKVIVQ